MTIENFYALHEGVVPFYYWDSPSDQALDSDPSSSVLRSHDVAVHRVFLGDLKVPSGKLAASDPFVTVDEPIVFNLTPGVYPVYATVADVSKEQDKSHYREAYVTIVISEKESVHLAPLLPEEPEDDNDEDDGLFYHIGVDAGAVAFHDYNAIEKYLQECGDDYGKFPDGLSEVEISTNEISYGVFSPYSEQEGNLIFCHSGWGDGFYPVMQTTDIDGKLTGIHIDLKIVGGTEDEEE